MFNKKKTNQNSPIQSQILAALGVIEDDLGESVPIEEIAFSLRVDFKNKMNEAKVAQIILELEKGGFVKNNEQKYSLLPKGAKIADEYLKTL